MHEYKAIIERAVDGDTYILLIDVGFDILTRQRVRLSRINTPELSTPEGKDVLKYVKTYEGKNVIVKTVGKDVYGRYLAEVTLEDGTNFNDYLLEKGFAKPYERPLK